MRSCKLSRRKVLVTAAATLAPAAGIAGEDGKGQKTGGTMERVQGIGGFFFRAKDPKKLGTWYEQHLGINPVPQSYDAKPWRQQAGTTVFAPFPQDTDFFGDKGQQRMINFRVRDLDAMAAQLRAAGIKVEIDPETYPNGRFAKVVDPEGNPIQLWQPGGVDPG